MLYAIVHVPFVDQSKWRVIVGVPHVVVSDTGCPHVRESLGHRCKTYFPVAILLTDTAPSFYLAHSKKRKKYTQ